MTVKIRFDENGDARCGYCHRILFKCKPNALVSGIEIKCHSCKAINVPEARKCAFCKWRKQFGGDEFVCACERSGRLGEAVSNNDLCDSFERR